MKKINLVQPIAILANVGVITGIMFLAIQIRDSKIEARTIARLEMGSLVIGWYDKIANNEQVARIYREGLANFNSLTDDERTQFDALMRSLLNMVDTTIIARDNLAPGVFPPLEERLFEGYLFFHLDQPGFRQWWSTTDRRAVPSQISAFLIERLDKAQESDGSGD